MCNILKALCFKVLYNTLYNNCFGWIKVSEMTFFDLGWRFNKVIAMCTISALQIHSIPWEFIALGNVYAISWELLALYYKKEISYKYNLRLILSVRIWRSLILNKKVRFTRLLLCTCTSIRYLENSLHHNLSFYSGQLI